MRRGASASGTGRSSGSRAIPARRSSARHGRSTPVYLYPDPQVRARVLAEVTPGLYRDLETTITTADGGTRTCAWTNLSARIQIPGLAAWGIGFDITDRKRAEAALRESERRLRTLTEALPQLVWTSEPDGALDYSSVRNTEYHGLTPEQLRGWDWQSTVHPEDLPRSLELWLRSIATGEPYETEHRRAAPTGRLPLASRKGRLPSATIRAGSPSAFGAVHRHR